MADGDAAFVDFRCSHCDSVLCRTDGESVRLPVRARAGDLYEAEYSVRRIDFVCNGCGLTRIWRRQYERRQRKAGHQH